jgi:hypothetical protein
MAKENRADFMKTSHKEALGNLPRTHRNCIEKVKIARPGKTAHDKARNVWSTQSSRHGVREDSKGAKR